MDMIQSFFVPGPLPGANNCLWKHWRTFQKIKKEQQALIAVAIKKARLKHVPRAVVKCEWFEPNKRRDLDNVMFAQKFIFDALVQTGILDDDGWDEIARIEHTLVLYPEKPGVRVTLEDA